MNDCIKATQVWAQQLQIGMEEGLMRPYPSAMNYFLWIDSSVGRVHPFSCMPSSNLTNYQWIAPTQLVKISESDNKAKAMIQEKGQMSKV